MAGCWRKAIDGKEGLRKELCQRSGLAANWLLESICERWMGRRIRRERLRDGFGVY